MRGRQFNPTPLRAEQCHPRTRRLVDSSSWTNAQNACGAEASPPLNGEPSLITCTTCIKARAGFLSQVSTSGGDSAAIGVVPDCFAPIVIYLHHLSPISPSTAIDSNCPRLFVDESCPSETQRTWAMERTDGLAHLSHLQTSLREACKTAVQILFAQECWPLVLWTSVSFFFWFFFLFLFFSFL